MCGIPQWRYDYPCVPDTWKMIRSDIVLSNLPRVLVRFKSLPVSVAEVILPLLFSKSPQCTSVTMPHT